MEELKNYLATTNFTTILKDEKEFNASHNYKIVNKEIGNILTAIKFQEGPIKETEINGIFMEDLLFIIIDRLESFQDSDWNCKENKNALKHIYEAIFWLNSRTKKRQFDGKYGTYNK